MPTGEQLRMLSVAFGHRPQQEDFKSWDLDSTDKTPC